MCHKDITDDCTDYYHYCNDCSLLACFDNDHKAVAYRYGATDYTPDEWKRLLKLKAFL